MFGYIKCLNLFIIKFLLFNTLLLNVVFAANAKFKKAQAARQNVEIFSDHSFDAKVLKFINPGKYYYISNKTYGPFYKIKIDDKIIGYVADTEIEIEGVGRLIEKPFIDELEAIQNGPADKTNKKKKKPDIDPEPEPEEDEDESILQTHYHGLILSLVNYRETTMDQSQIADLIAVGYRYIPFLSDYSSTVSWDVNLSYGIPDYYKKNLKTSGYGGTLWAGTQLLNITHLDHNKTIRYGAGPFLKYANYNLTGAETTYSLQELTLGFLIEGGLIVHFDLISLDVGLRLYWERESYGGLSLGFLF